MKHTWISKIKKYLGRNCEPGLKAQKTVHPLYWNSTKWLLNLKNKTSWVLKALVHQLPPGLHIGNSYSWWKIVVRKVSHNSLHLNAEQHIKTTDLNEKAAVMLAVFLVTSKVWQKHTGWDLSQSHCSSVTVLIEFKASGTWNIMNFLLTFLRQLNACPKRGATINIVRWPQVGKRGSKVGYSTS